MDKHKTSLEHCESGVEPIDQKHQDGLPSSYVPDTEEERKLVRKIDLFLLPTIFLMYLLSYMDRTNIGNAKIAGMYADLDLDSERYSIALVVFFVGYVVFEVPSNMLLARTRPSVFLPTIMFIWGCITIGMGFIQDYKTLIGIRALVGIMEAGFAPGVLLVLSSWYKKSEQAKRFGIYISAAILSGAFGGLLGGAITDDLDGVHGITFMLLDFPENVSSRKFSAREKELAIKRLLSEEVHNQTEDMPRLSHLQALKQALTNWRVWLFVVGYMAIVGSSTLSYFYPTLVNGLGYTGNLAQYMTIPIYVVAFICTAITIYFMDRHPQLRGLVLGCWITVAMVCSIVICVVYNFQGRYALLVIMASGLWASNGLSLAYASSTFGAMPNEVRGISLAFVNAMGNLAQIYGAYLFPSEDSPKYLKGFGVISGLCLTGVISYLALYVLLKRWPLRV
ncbi:major facilitator superfamily domain-containing protein [Whalleya microplaca]|nr:major facilitator superfamily domain-containing protein [Whalleya microplaca]